MAFDAEDLQAAAFSIAKRSVNVGLCHARRPCHWFPPITSAPGVFGERFLDCPRRWAGADVASAELPNEVEAPFGASLGGEVMIRAPPPAKSSTPATARPHLLAARIDREMSPWVKVVVRVTYWSPRPIQGVLLATSWLALFGPPPQNRQTDAISEISPIYGFFNEKRDPTGNGQRRSRQPTIRVKNKP